MKTSFFIALVCLMTLSFSALAQPGQPGQPTIDNDPDDPPTTQLHELNHGFVVDCEDWFSGRYGQDGEIAFANRFGYGTGVVEHNGQKTPFSWFAFTNTDAYLQFYLDCDFNPEWKKYFFGVVDDLDRHWDIAASLPYGTWIGTSNDCMLNNTDKAIAQNWDYFRSCLGQTITKMVKETEIITNMTIVGYY